MNKEAALREALTELVDACEVAFDDYNPVLILEAVNKAKRLLPHYKEKQDAKG